MKYLLMILAVVVIFAGQALAADGNLSHSMLAKMGLSGMNVMSDAQGTAVRGMGYATVYGRSTARLLGSAGTSSFSASGGNVVGGSSNSLVVFNFNNCFITWTAAGSGAIAFTKQ